MRVADVLARRLCAAGVRHAFGIAGGEVITLIDALELAGVRVVTARHETAAGLMAEGAWVATGAPGLLVVTVGPGVSNAVNAVANAYLDRIPLIVISGVVDAEVRAAYTHQVFDQAALLQPVVKGTFIATRNNVALVIEQALALATAHPRGPVHIELPVSEANAELTPRLQPQAASDAVSPVRLGDDQLERIAALVANAQRPLVLAGLEACDAAVAAALHELLQVRPMPVLTTYKAKGVIDERSANCIGAIGLSPKADQLARPLIQAADVVVLVGYDPVEMRSSYVRPFDPGCRVIELAACARKHGMHRAQREVVGDLSTILRQLSAEVRRHQRLARTWENGLPAATCRDMQAAFAPSSIGFGPLSVAHALSTVLPKTAHMTIDTGAHRIVLSQVLQSQAPRQVLQSNGLCTMGYALPCAIGVALASGKPVVAAMGDAGFEMVMGELATLRDLQLPVTLVIFDDSSLALIDVKQHAAGLARHAVWLGATDHVAIARSFGGHGVRVHDLPGLQTALDAALARPSGFSVISCAIERGAYADLL